MLQFSDLTIDAAVANQSGAMEADTISKNGQSSRIFKVFVNYLIIAVLAVATPMIIPSCAKDGKDGEPGKQGEKGDKGDSGANAVITISDDGYWVINGTKTDVKAEGTQGAQGEPGTKPVITISNDGYWVIDGVKTDIKAKGEQGNDGNNSYLVIFDANGGTPLFRIYGVSHGDKVTAPAEPTKDGYIFGGWYTDVELKNAWVSASTVTTNATLYAKWIPDINSTIALDRYAATPVEVDDGKGGIQRYRLDYFFDATHAGETYHIYYIYLGKIDWVPIASNTAIYYNGTTPIELTYSSTQTKTESITEAMSKTVSNTTQTVNTYNNVFNVEISGETGKILNLFAKGNIKTGYSHSWGGSGSVTDVTSKTETTTTFESWATSNTETKRYTIGNRDEPPGFYRFALFATCDVYIAVVHDLKEDEWYYEYSVFARPNTLYEAIDYQTTNDFGVGADAMRLRFDTSIIESLPEIEQENSSTFNIKFSDYNANAIVSLILHGDEQFGDSYYVTYNYCYYFLGIEIGVVNNIGEIPIVKYPENDGYINCGDGNNINYQINFDVRKIQMSKENSLYIRFRFNNVFGFSTRNIVGTLSLNRDRIIYEDIIYFDYRSTEGKWVTRENEIHFHTRVVTKNIPVNISQALYTGRFNISNTINYSIDIE